MAQTWPLPQLCSQHTPFPVRLFLNTDAPTMAYPKRFSLPHKHVRQVRAESLGPFRWRISQVSQLGPAQARLPATPKMRDFVNSASSQLKGFAKKAYPDCVLPIVESTCSHAPWTLLPPLTSLLKSLFLSQPHRPHPYPTGTRSAKKALARLTLVPVIYRLETSRAELKPMIRDFVGNLHSGPHVLGFG